ncbi:hypothetical protein [Tautonia rosea]|uniref:hypothetical protein n=1 Tax=Tautonia rosea TaxID=2728037 RepID=UPI001472B083|nr:hypothetical protein [Tautonia rosea]
MIGSPLVRETTVSTRSASSRVVAPPVLIEVPTLPGSGPHRSRVNPRRPVSSVKPRRRLRREVRLVGLTMLMGLLAVSAAIAVWSRESATAEVEVADELPPVSEPFGIELEVPILDPVDSPLLDDRVEQLPVAFPGYLLPGESDGDGEEEHGHARP